MRLLIVASGGMCSVPIMKMTAVTCAIVMLLMSCSASPLAADATGSMVGRWMDSAPGIRGVISITSNLRMEQEFDDGSVRKIALRMTKTGRGQRFDTVPASRDYYVLVRSGDLEIWDDQGLIRTARSLRR